MLRINHQRSLQAFICTRILGQDAFADKLLTHTCKSVVLQFLSVSVHVAALGDRAGMAKRGPGRGVFPVLLQVMLLLLQHIHRVLLI